MAQRVDTYESDFKLMLASLLTVNPKQLPLLKKKLKAAASEFIDEAQDDSSETATRLVLGLF